MFIAHDQVFGDKRDLRGHLLSYLGAVVKWAKF